MPLQRSFSEQNYPAKQKPHRSQWSRNKSYQGKPSSRPNLSALKEKPPVPVSQATKNKLSNFQFGGQVNADYKAQAISSLLSDNENKNEVFVRSRFKNSEDDHLEAKLEKKIKPSHPHGTKEIPSTPARKLALPDLIGMGDVRRMISQPSPEDRIEWDHNKGSSLDNILRFGAANLRKRARSSSPTGSPPILTSHQFDPASELWKRYSACGSRVSNSQGPPIPALAHIMQISSPKLTTNNGSRRSAGELRRSNSCGNQLPKRRRADDKVPDDLFNDLSTIGPSKLSVLIERVQEGLSQPETSPKPQETSLDQSNSLQRIVRTKKDLNDIPKSCNDLMYDPGSLLNDQKIAPQPPPNVPTINPLPRGSDYLSDYGDFDDDELDASLVEVLGSNPGIPILQPLTRSKSISSPKSLSHTRRISSKECENSPITIVTNTSHLVVTEDNTDDFGDSEDDIFSADLEVLVSQYDTGIVENKMCMAKPITAEPSEYGNLKSESEDEFKDDSLDDADFEAAEANATHAIWETLNSHMAPNLEARVIQRYLVTHIMDSTYEDVKLRNEKILLLQIENSKQPKVVHLRGFWIETPVTVGAYVHVIGIFDSNGRCIIDDDKNMLILHPDHLISSTVVADSFGCIRRAVLQDRVKATNGLSAPLVYGTILHEIFQAAMISNRWDSGLLSELIKSIAAKHIEDLYTIKIQISQAVEYLESKMTEVQCWAELYISSQPKPKAIAKALNGETVSMCVAKLLDIEEHVWSPMYGLKGNIDATVQVTISDKENYRTLTVPFEVKTGKNKNISHYTQTALYNLLLSDRYDIDVVCGILYYMETSETIRIPNIRHDLRHMIMQRNELACYVRERSSQLPPMIKKENMCNYCYAKVPCFIYHKLAEDGTSQTSGLTKFDDFVRHLSPKHKEFFLKWDDLLTKEEKESLRFRRELWTMLSSEREKLGRCFSNVVIEQSSSYEDQKGSKINRYQYNMVKEVNLPGFSFLDSQITVGEPIVISDERGHFALANGYVVRVSNRRITVQVDRRLHNTRVRLPGFDEVNNQSFVGIMEVPSKCAHINGKSDETDKIAVEPPMKYRLDKDEFSNGMALIRNNLVQIMADDPFGSRQIRSLVVDLNAPRFKTHASAYVLQDRSSINIDQRRAIQKVMSAQDYALVLGMPGTGKTTTIAHIIRALVSQGKSVLLTSYTHTAVDNILLKLKDDTVSILRLGQISKISPEVQKFVILASRTGESFGDIQSAWHETPIVATTCLGINHAIFMERTFDYCIVDEASQITLPICLGPIRLARTFILVGDHFQLPPLVQNEEARKGGLDISLFKHLSDMHPNSVVYLEHQYRMCEDIMTLSNSLIYDGRLKCGSQEVARREISIPNMDNLKYNHFSSSAISSRQQAVCPGSAKSRCWLYDLISPSTKVSFINTDPLVPISREEARGNRIVNPVEAKICTQLVQGLLSVGVLASSIGVMTLYRSQLALLKHHLGNNSEVEMHTADRFQGRDKEVIILSLVRSNDSKSIGELLKDWRRINVAFTRAKTKLLVIGSRDTLKGNIPGVNQEEEMVARFVKLIESKNWVYNLPQEALNDHIFEEQMQVSSETTQQDLIQMKPPLPGAEEVEIKSGHDAEEKKLKTEEDLGTIEKNVQSVHGKSGKRQPKKWIFGNRLFKMSGMDISTDVDDESLY